MGGVAPSFPKTKSAEPRSLLGILTVGGPDTGIAGGEKKSSLIEIGDIVVTQTNEDVNIMDFPHGFSKDFFGDFEGFQWSSRFRNGILYQCSNNVSTLSPNAGMMVLQSYVPGSINSLYWRWSSHFLIGNPYNG